MKLPTLLFALYTCVSATLLSQTETYDNWIRTARIGGLSLLPGSSAAEIDVLVASYRDQGVSVIELDSGLSNYLSGSEFAAQVAHIDLVAQRAHVVGLKVVIYYPSLEVLTPNGANISSTMGKDHPDWLQIGMNGTPNVFYGTQEHWVEPNAESAWMSANSPGYKNYFISRVQQLASSSVDGVWIDVPLYLDTGVQWADVRPEAVAAFEAWSATKGYNYSGSPASPDMANQKFRHWLQWRNDNLADFIDEVRAAAMATNPNWAFVTEVYPLDYLDTIWTGLEPAVLKRADNSIVVWELDGVSDSLGMEYANLEDFSSLIAMTKMARAFDRGRPGWGFSYGNLPIDAGLVMGSTIAEQLSPFESKTPIMTNSVGSDFRTKWFEFVRDNEDALLKTGRVADVGVWFSPATKTFHDYAQGGIYGMYLDLNPPPSAESWWAVLPELSLRATDHLAGWRGAAYALNELHVPYKAVVDPGDLLPEMEGLSLMWLPSVAVLSDGSAQILRDFVSNGGTLLATGLMPGLMDEHGVARAQSNLADVFGFTSAGPGQGPRMNSFGQGAAIFRPDIKGVDLFETGGAAGASAKKEINHGQIEQIVRIHTPDRLIADEVGEGIHLTLSEASATAQHAFILNYSGLQKPAVMKPARVPFHYRAPDGFRVTGAQIRMPGSAALNGVLPVVRSGEGTWMVEPLVEQFAIVSFELSPVPPALPSAPPVLQFSSQEREDAVTDALSFVVTQMRHSSATPPHSYGVRTNLIDNNLDTTVYTGGHHVTDEHMGLFLRVTALLQNQGRYDEALEFVREVLFSKGYHVLAWSMHKDKLKPFLQPDLLNEIEVWMTANAPLDDLRSVRGLFDGAAAFDQAESEALAHKVLNGMYWTSVTDRLRGQSVVRPQYPGGLIGYSWDWENHDDNTLVPPAVGTGLGRLGADLIPVDYQDLGTLAIGARDNPRLRSVIASAVDLMLAAEIPGTPGLFYNGLDQNNQWTGDFEFPGERQGNNLKVIQELWTALHLARVSMADAYVLDAARRQAAGAAAQRSLSFFKAFYNVNGQRVPEYLTFAGTDVPDGTSGNNLVRGVENLFGGEARIYSQLARLALLFDDDAFAAAVIEDKILTDRITTPSDPRFGLIGASTAGANDAEAFNVLESLLTLCLEAQQDVAPPANSAPVANPDLVQGGKDTPLLIPAVDLLGNDTDAEHDVLSVASVDPVTTQGGSISIQGTRWLYTPPAGFLGDDSFSYTVTDGRASASSACTIEVSEGGGVALDIARDGNLSDWPAGHFVVSDPDDISGVSNLIDLREIHLTVQNNNLWIGYVNEGPVVYNWAYLLYIDADKNPSTGFQVGDIGADYILEENMLQLYTGLTGEDWAWQLSAVATPAIVGDTVELSLPLSSFGGSTAMRLLFVGDNLAYEPNGVGEDYVPEPNPNGQWIHYDLALNLGSVGDPGAAADGIDGDLSDWPAGHFVVLDPDDVSGSANKLDLRELHLRAADGKLLLGYVNEQAIDYNYAYLLYIDADANPATGFQFDDLGVDFIVQDNQVQSYSGTGADWAWSNVQAVSSAVLNDTAELSLPLASLGNPTTIRVQFYGDNTAYPGGTTVDYVPDQNEASSDTYVQFNTVTNVGSIGGAPDADLIPNDWEIANGLDPSSNDSLLDPEADGVPSVVEWVLDQSPLDPDVEPLRISLIEVGNEVEAMVEYRYTDGAELAVTIELQKSADPLSASWTTLPAPSPSPPVAGVVSVSVTDAERFDLVAGTGPLAMHYRLRITGADNGTPFSYVSPMVGYRRQRCPDGSDTHLGFMFRPAAVHRADCAVAPASSGSGLWTVNDPGQPAEVAVGQTVRFETGALAGKAFRITAVTPASFQVAGDLSAVVSGDRYRIAPTPSFASLLSTAGVVLEDSITFLGLDRGHELLTFEPRGVGMARSASGVYYHLPTGWRSTGSVSLPESARSFDPDQAFVLRAAGPAVISDGWIVMAGAEIDSAIAITIGAGGTETVVTMPKAVPLKLRDSALVSSGAFEGSVDGLPVSRKDELMIYSNAELALNKAPAATYYYDLSAAQWRSTADPASDAGDVELPPGAFLRIRSASGGPATWTLPAAP